MIFLFDRTHYALHGPGIVVRVDHDDHALPGFGVGHQEGVETLVTSAMRKGQRLSAAAKAEAQPAVTALLNRQHLAGHRLRDHRIRFACQRLLDADGETRQIGGRRPQARRRLSG